ncbi:ChaB family protein [Kangiella koreensis]|uniref:ChaB family protein n=1 Tax=Kangiella koreensis (strain DSM 16069 / JCM 12317 / KCTC 12182 / SW-125) TaxID=523791 RepID=C7R7Q6_KANKD|nr:ChaB family protein [Kangiella koreensis]ACV27589.1 ChaB family protein [Kangiella koreensis DSM 16069]
MPYQSNDELPESVRNNLPKHAQDIYRKAFNSAWDEYKNPEDRRGNDSREEVAHKVAWSAVKNEYHKEEGEWVRDES